MKKIIIPFVVMVVTISACKKDFLDPKIVNTLTTEEGTFSDSARTIAFVNDIYTRLGSAIGISNRFNGNGTLSGAVDESWNADASTSNQANLINQATLTPTNIGAGASLTLGDDRGYWQVWWSKIRACNIAVRDIPGSPLPADMKKRLLGEVRFLRAFFYASLMKMYGGVPLLGNTVFTTETPVDVPRSSYDDNVKYVVAELDTAETMLYNGDEVIRDVNQATIFDGPGADNGRITKGTCQAMKSRVLLYAASPLFNGSNISLQLGGAHPELTGYASLDKERWKLAADAADVVINSNKYALRLDNTTEAGYGFYLTFVTRPIQPKPELILAVMAAPAKTRETDFDPPSRGGNAKTYPYQELVDAFPMKNGKAINESGSGYVATDPYANRDPRFYNTVLHNEGLRFLQSAGTRTKVFTYYQASLDGLNTSTRTGYYCMKTIDRNVTAAGSATSPRCDPLIRYAEILLNAAEATNEYYGPIAKVYTLLGQIRNRAGIAAGADGLYGIAPGLSQAAMRSLIQNERRIELAFEDHRIWDIRRWKIGAVVMDKVQHGMKIDPRTGGGYTYTQIDCLRTYWRDNLYLFPITQYEIAKNPAMFQNPGW